MARIPVAVLGATGAVGQRFVQLLARHPWFEIAALAASEHSAGRLYAQVAKWAIPGDPPSPVGEMVVSPLQPDLPARIAFSALPSAVARQVEPRFAAAGYLVCSNASAFRQEPDVPLIIPEVNADHLALVEAQRARRGWPGLIVTSPNCTTTTIVLPLKPLDRAFGLRQVVAVSMQAVSGAGYPGVASLDILGNVVPYIAGEEEKIEAETRLLLGRLEDGRRIEAGLVVSAQANRVPVLDGHTVCLSLGFERRPGVEGAAAALAAFRGPDSARGLPSAPEQPVVVRSEPDRPQPRRDRDAQDGMAVTVGRLRPCPLLDLRLVSVSHNTLRGAASGSILNAELLVAEGYAGRGVAREPGPLGGRVVIERAGLEDAEEILALQKLAYQSEAAIYDEYGIPPLTQRLEEIRASFQEQVFLKATLGGRVVGSVRANMSEGSCLIGRLIVHPDLQNQGIGSRLLAEIERAFGHARRFELFTGHKSERNLYLYRKFGYRPFRSEKASEALTILFLEKSAGAPGGVGEEETPK